MEYGDTFSILKISYYPVDETFIQQFVTGLDEVWVLEEGEPIVEETVRKYYPKTRGKLSKDISRVGELGPEVLAKHITGFIPDNTINTGPGLPVRPPSLCAGCQYRDFYTALNAAQPAFVTGDIGCYTLGANPPYNALDTCLCMGASISQATGIANQGVSRVAAVIGDSTFLHSGITGLLNAVYNKSNLLVIILDNDTVAMTGHQPTPMTGLTAKGGTTKKISLVEICKACGVDSVEVIDPHNIDKTVKLLKTKLTTPGVHVVIPQKPCIFVSRTTKQVH
jgi:indolepyruvate ferredoxin oxidoreductase alpha subunit